VRSGSVAKSNVAFLYWGRRGFSRFTLEAAHAARDIGLNAFFSVSTANEIYPEFRQLGSSVFPVDTFRFAPGALINAPNVFQIRRRLVDWLTERNVRFVVVLMSHVWTPFMAQAIKSRGIHYSVVVHDVQQHPGDLKSMVVRWLLKDAKAADTILTLSGWVRDELVKWNIAPAERIKPLFMPDITYPSVASAALKARRRESGQPFRVLLFGRLLRYKGLPLFVEAMELLAADGIPVEVTVCGEGDLRGMSPRLAGLGATVLNKWLDDNEVGQVLTSHDLVVLTHIEASQSGVIAAALGAGVPVVTTPVGGLADQVRSRGAGLVSERTDARAIADCIRNLALDCTLYNAIVDQIGSYRSFSVAHFLRQMVDALHGNAEPVRIAAPENFSLIGSQVRPEESTRLVVS
jgi:glycosyltransferase involved in cell wall biosynthesis